jgi:hypothetical protein
MDKDIDAIASQFDMYDKLGWYDRWKFRRHLSWLGQDRISLGYLLELEQKLKWKSFASFRIAEIIEELLRQYNKEGSDNRLPNCISREQLPYMLQVMTIFYSKSWHLHRSWRGLIVGILQAEEEIKAYQGTGSSISAEQFRVEAAKAISNLSTDWSKKDDAYLKCGANYLLLFLTNLAKHVSDLQMFTQFQHEAEKIIAHYGLWELGRRLHPLGTIAGKVGDLQTFKIVFQDIVPVLGLETTSSLLEISKDFQEFEVYYPRINEQLAQWRSSCSIFNDLFIKRKNTAEWDRLLVFLETLAKHARMAKYIHYAQVHHSGTLLQYISNALFKHKSQVFNGCLSHDWSKEAGADQLMDDLIDTFEKTILDDYLDTIWSSLLQASNIRWEFSKFTDSIPYGIINWEWTQDNDKTRSYWNWRDAERREHDRFIRTLESPLLSLFRTLEFSDIETLFDLLPQHLGVEAYTTTVKVPTGWGRSIEYHEAYDKWAGNYTQEVEVARPTNFVDHIFTFERPCLENAINLLITQDRVDEAIQAHRKSRI